MNFSVLYEIMYNDFFEKVIQYFPKTVNRRCSKRSELDSKI